MALLSPRISLLNVIQNLFPSSLKKKKKKSKTTIITKSQQSEQGRPAPTALLSCAATSFGRAAEVILFVPTVFNGVTCKKPFGTQSSRLTDLVPSLFPYQSPQGKIMDLVP